MSSEVFIPHVAIAGISNSPVMHNFCNRFGPFAREVEAVGPNHLVQPFFEFLFLMHCGNERLSGAHFPDATTRYTGNRVINNEAQFGQR